MIKQTLKFITILTWATTSIAADKADLALINIDNIGERLLNEIKNNSNVDWWVEMGDKMVIATDLSSKEKLPKHLSILSTKSDVDVSNIAFQSLGHCNHSDETEKLHKKLDVVFANTSFQIVNSEKITDKTQLSSHDLIIPFSKNKVLLYQYKNRSHKTIIKAGDQMQSLVDKVDKDRWFEQVEYLSSLDRMEHDDLVIAGEWLESKFSNLGLITSRIVNPTRRGFNILGFKQGTTTPDNWYVVGGHIDSRNQQWNDNQPSPGAEDNASGCSGVLEIANVMSQYETESSIVFMCFTAEERGLLGSADVVTQLTQDGDINKVKGMLNMDMISYRLGDRNVAIAGTDTNNFESITTKLADYGDTYTDIDWQISYTMCCTDFLRFSDVGIPSVTSNQPDISTYFGYHQTNDLPENIDPILGAGIVKANLATLADLVGIDFASGEPPAYLITGAHSGLWYNQEQSGHGLNVEVLPDNKIVAVWYTFDNVGNQMWLLGVGTYENNIATLDVTISENGVFPPNFVAEDVTHNNWGTFQFEFTECNIANFGWVPNEEFDFTAGELQLSRLTKIEGTSCESET